MRIVYLDTLICVNLFIDFLILYIIKRALHINVKSSRVLLGSVFGALCTLSILLPIHSIFITALYKIGTAILIIYISYGKSSFTNISIRLLTYFGLNMILSATVISINLLWKPTGVFIYNDNIYFDISPTVLLITTGAVYIVLNIYHRIISAQKIKSSVHKVTFSVKNKGSITFEAAVDTGCCLKEPFSGLPVILIEKDIIKSLTPNKDKMRIIPYSTAAGSDYVYGFKPTHLDIDGREIYSGCYIGLLSGKLKGEIKSIMGPELMEVI